MPRPSGQKLTPAEHQRAAEQAYASSLKGTPYGKIAQELNVSRNTVGSLVREERLRRRAERPEAVQQALDHYDALIAEGWIRLERIVSPNAYNVPAILNSIAKCQERKDILLGSEAPKRADVRQRIERVDLSVLDEAQMDAVDGHLAAVEEIFKRAGAVSLSAN